MSPWSIAIGAGALVALLLGLLTGVVVAKNNQPQAVVTTLTFLKRVPAPAVTQKGKTVSVTVPITETETVTSSDLGTDTTVIKTTRVTTPASTVTETVTAGSTP